MWLYADAYREGIIAMEPITVDDRPDGGRDITIHLTREQSAALGGDAYRLADWLHTVMYTVAALRTDTATVGEKPASQDPRFWYLPIDHLDNRLLPRLKAIRDAAIRAHALAGGTYADLAIAMDAPRSTAQRRRDKVMDSEPSAFERWACGTAPGQRIAPVEG